MAEKMDALEGRVCGMLIVLLLVVMAVCLVVITWPLLLALCLPYQQASCQVYQLPEVHGVTNCSRSWMSCQSSCTNANLTLCKQIYVQYWLSDNTTSIVPLFTNVMGCGFDIGYTCPQFYQTFSTHGYFFECHVYSDPQFAVPSGKNTNLKIIKYLLLSLIPLLALIITCFYAKKRKLLPRGYKTVKKAIKKKSNEHLSFYQKKLLELEFKKNLRQLKIKNTQNDVKIFDLENAQTTGALILKPSFLTMVQPPKIII